EPHLRGQPAYVVMSLDGRRGPFERQGFDDVRVERSLSQPGTVAEPRGFLFEDRDELGADALALELRVGDPSQHVEETARSVDVDEVQLEGAPEGVTHRLGLAFPKDAVIHEHARELIPDRTVDEHGDDGGVDAARERTEDAVTADLGANRLDGR